MTVLAAIGASFLKQDYFPPKKQRPIALFKNQFTAIADIFIQVYI